MGLDVLRQVAEGTAAERILRYLVEFGDAPEVQITLIHCLEHFGEWVNRAHDGRVEQHDFIEMRQILPAMGFHGRLVSPYVEALVRADDEIISVRGQFRLALGVEFSIADNRYFGEMRFESVEQCSDVIVHDAVGIVEEENSKTVH